MKPLVLRTDHDQIVADIFGAIEHAFGRTAAEDNLAVSASILNVGNDTSAYILRSHE